MLISLAPELIVFDGVHAPIFQLEDNTLKKPCDARFFSD